jgi:tryptophan synthase alpha chain
MGNILFNKRPGIIAYVTCGDPDIQTTRDIVSAAIGAGADVVELGVPFSDPVADGPVIQRASDRALQNGVSLQDVIRLAYTIRRESTVGLVIFSYWNPVLRFGIDRFCSAASYSGVDGALIVDLTVEESYQYRRAAASHNLSTIFLAAPTSTDRRLQQIAQACSGFIYAVSRTGVTGAQKELHRDAYDLVTRIRKFTTLPIAVGFGISNSEQYDQVANLADAAVIGSALVQAVEQNPEHAAAAVSDLFRSLLKNAPRTCPTNAFMPSPVTL